MKKELLSVNTYLYQLKSKAITHDIIKKYIIQIWSTMWTVVQCVRSKLIEIDCINTKDNYVKFTNIHKHVMYNFKSIVLMSFLYKTNEDICFTALDN